MITSFRKRPTRRAAIGAALAVSVILALTACATGPTEEGDTGGTGDLKTGTEQTSYDDWSLAFDACMAAQGVNLPKSDASEEGEEDDSPTVELNEGDVAAFKKAEEHCIAKVGEPPVRPGAPTDDELNEQMLVFAKCMREAGYDYPDPVPGSGGLAPAIGGDDIDPAVLDQCGVKAGFPDAKAPQ